MLESEEMQFLKFLKSTVTDKSTELDLEQCKTVIAATILNLCLKAPVVTSDEMSMLFGLMKNTKSQRVLYCVQSLAILSCHFKTKQFLIKERR